MPLRLEAAVDVTADEARNTMSAPTGAAIPLFRFRTPSLWLVSYGVIQVGTETFHKIGDTGVFYAALGYSRNENAKGVLPDEFIWEHYTRDQAKIPPHCLQRQISVYLHKNSAKFVNLYGQAYAAMFGQCCADEIGSDDGICPSCPMHPSLATEPG